MNESSLVQCRARTRNGHGARCKKKIKPTDILRMGVSTKRSYCHLHATQLCTGTEFENMPDLEVICAICQEICEESSNFIKTICNHSFHQACWLKMYKCPDTIKCPLCRQKNPTPTLTPHIYSVAAVQTGFLEWELLLRENYYYDYADPEERKKIVLERLCSGVRHAKLHGASTLSISGPKILLDEVFLNSREFSSVISTFSLLYEMVYMDCERGEYDNLCPFLFVTLHD